MKIISIELYKYKRFALNSINMFSMKITESLQLILGTNGSGKAQPLDSFIKTPIGWSTMGQMAIGTEVIAKDGTVCKVSGVFPQGKKEIFKITFSDGRTAECCKDHLWKIYVGGKKYPIVPEIVDTKEIIRLLNTKTYNNLVWIDLVDSEENEDLDLPIDPYLLGVFLGDGCGVGPVSVITTPDDFIAKEISQLIPKGCALNERADIKNGCKNYSIVRKPGYKEKNVFTSFLIDNNLLGKRSYEKSIPEKYLFGSTKQRLSLLQGLMDTDGYIDVESTSSYTTTSYDLAMQVQYLIRSLGGIANIVAKSKYYTHLNERKLGRIAYQVNIRYKKPSDLFRLPRKKNRAKDNGQYCATLKLRIKSVESIGYKEAQCITIDHPDKLYVTNDFVVTHNSSMLKQLTPLPPEQKEFYKGGYKKIIIEHHNSTYELLSTFDGGQKHTFIRDGVILNNEGTVTIQKDLVKEYFLITPEIHSLISGKDLFSLMSTNKRKDWFLQLCDTNYDYAMKVYNRLRERLRDTSGALKLAKKRLTVESEKLIKDDEEKRLTVEVEELHKILNQLLECRKPLEDDLDLLSIEQSTLDKNLLALTNNLLTIVEQIKEETLTESMLMDRIKECDLELYSIGKQISDLTIKFDLNNKKINILRKAEQNTISGLVKELQGLQDNSNRVITSLMNGELSNPNYASDSFKNIKNSLIDLLSMLPKNDDKKYTQDKLISTKEELTKLTLRKEDIAKRLAEFNTKISHMERHRDNPDLACPKCNHMFSLGYSELIYKDSVAFRDKANIDLQTTNTEIKSKEEYIEVCTEYSITFRQILQIMNNSPELNIYWMKIKESNVLYNDPQSLIIMFNNIESDISRQIDLSKLRDVIKEKKDLLDSLKEIGDGDLNQIVNDNISISEQIEALSKQQITLVNSKKDYSSRRSVLLTKDNLINQIRGLIINKKTIFKTELETIRRIHLNNLIVSLQNTLAAKVEAVNSFKSHQSLIDDINKQINILSTQESSLKELVSVISPTDGLIAEGLTGFINSFVEQMNFFIKKIWSYPLIIQACGYDSEEAVDLNYKFPVIVNNDDNIINDVSEGSTGMLDIINLAFRITAMQYLGLSHYPLGLDEWGSGFDAVHRNQAVNAIKALTDQHIFDQLFIISHYAESFGALSNPEVCVLDISNIELPKNILTYNKHVVIE